MYGKPRLYTCCKQIIKIERFAMSIPKCKCGKTPKSVDNVKNYPVVFNKWIKK